MLLVCSARSRFGVQKGESLHGSRCNDYRRSARRYIENRTLKRFQPWNFDATFANVLCAALKSASWNSWSITASDGKKRCYVTQRMIISSKYLSKDFYKRKKKLSGCKPLSELFTPTTVQGKASDTTYSSRWSLSKISHYQGPLLAFGWIAKRLYHHVNY